VEFLPAEKSKRLFRRHFRGALVRSGTSIGMWTFALIAYSTGTYQGQLLVGVSITVIYLICINFPALAVLKFIKSKRAYALLSFAINEAEIIGYTAIIYFSGVPESSYLTLLYAALIVYVGVVAPRKDSFIVAGLCAVTFSCMVVLTGMGILPQFHATPGTTVTMPDLLTRLSVIIAMLFVVAYITASTANLLRTQRDSLHMQNIAMDKVNRQLIREIKERVRAEEEKKELQALLHRAQKMEAIGTLAGGVAHDINNILSGIVGYPDLLLLDIPEDSVLREPIIEIQESGNKVATIVQDLLTLARRGIVVTEVVNLNTVILEYLKSPEYEKLISYHPNVKVEKNLEPGLHNVVGSPVHLGKTVMNLVSNAAEAMPEGGTILIATHNRTINESLEVSSCAVEGSCVVFSISDSGVGMSADDLDKVFEPFYTKKKMGRSGTGLGMAVVWGTVQDHKGHIDVQSTEGEGTTFSLYLPATVEKQASKEPADLSIEDYKGSGESILVVDDVREQRQIANRILTQLGYSVTTVSSGEEAVAHMESGPEDLIILDMIMEPGIDGLDTYKKIIQTHPGQKAVIVSGYSETTRVQEVQRLGAGTFVKKPYTMEKIGLAVKAELAIP
jgi:signal transduction histidine kinase